MKPNLISLSCVILFAICFNVSNIFACSGGSYVAEITPNEYWHTLDSVHAGERYTLTLNENDIVIFSFCQDEGIYFNDPRIELHNGVGAITYAYNEDYCGLGAELVWVCPAAGLYSVGFYGEECSVDGELLGTVAYKLIKTATDQDCLGAVPLCTSFIDYPYAQMGAGNYYDIHDFSDLDTMAINVNNCPNCLVAGERNTRWYLINVQESGQLKFDLTSYITADDYDWAIYELSDSVSCGDLVDFNDHPPVSCNFSFGGNGNTGLGTGLSSCQGPVDGVGYNESLNVISGQEYVLVISNFSETSSGYTLDFENTTATIIDTEEPVAEELLYEPHCGASSFIIQFSEGIDCSTVEPNDFMLLGPSGEIAVENCTSLMNTAYSINTYSGACYDDVWTIEIADELIIEGDYSLILLNDSVSDKCGNLNNAGEFLFSILCVDEYDLNINIIGQGGVDVNGTIYSLPISITEDTEVNLEAIADPDWEFVDWSGDISSSETIETFTMDGDKTITATFAEIPEYTLTISIVGQGGVEANGYEYTVPLVFQSGSVALLTAIEELGWNFTAWSGDLNSTTPSQIVTMDSDKNITATFTEIIEYTLTINVIGQGAVEVDGVEYSIPISYQDGTEVSLQAIADPNWQFDGWTDDLISSENEEIIIVDSDKHVSVTFAEIIEYTLIVTIIGEGTAYYQGIEYTMPVEFVEGTELSIQAIADDNWQFAEWTGSISSSTSLESITMDENKEITATFLEDNQYALAINVIGGGEAYVNGISYSDPMFYYEGTEVMLQALPNSEWEFSHWAGDFTSEESAEMITIEEDLNIDAVFVPYVLKADVDFNGNYYIYPNPAYSSFSVVGEDVLYLEIINSLGQKIVKTVLKDNISLAKFNSGVYTVKIYTGEEIISRKLIVR